MEDVLEKLGLSSISDQRSIKAAYSKKLKLIDITNDPLEFQSLHEAYQQALFYISRDNISESVNLPKFDNDQPDLRAANESGILEKSDSFSAILIDLGKITKLDNFDFLLWLESYKNFDSIEARANLSKRMMFEFVTNGNNWSFKLMRAISETLNWNEVSLEGHHNYFFSQFLNVLENANFHQIVRPSVNSYFQHPWKNRHEATDALYEIVKGTEQTYHAALAYAVHQAACANSSAWAAVLTAQYVFNWDLDYAKNQALELSLREARFREKLHEVTGEENRAPYDVQENAIWRLRKPFDYLDGYHPIEPITHVLNLADAYGINKNTVFSAEQLEFYLGYQDGSNDTKSGAFFTRFYKILVPVIIILALIKSLSSR